MTPTAHLAELAQHPEFGVLYKGFIDEGRKYGYPDCCILFFLVEWFPHVVPGRSRLKANRQWVEAYRAQMDAAGWAGQQIPCRACLRKNWEA